MNDWSRNRKRLIFSLALLAFIVLVAIPLYFLLYRAPSCFDSKLNGDETGVDCGGSCQLLCQAESLPLLVKGDPRVLTISPNTYEIVALVENPNNTGEIYHAGYTLKVYDATSPLPSKIIEGETYVPQGEVFAIFERPFHLESSVAPKRVTLEWHKETLLWRKSTLATPDLRVKDTKLSREDTTPRLDAVIENLSQEDVSNVELIALLSDAQGNIFAASSTFLDKVSSGGQAQAVFTWPQAFALKVVDIKIIMRIFPDKSFIR